MNTSTVEQRNVASFSSERHPYQLEPLSGRNEACGSCVFLYFEPSCISVFLLSADWTTMGSGGAQQDCQVWGNIRRNPQKTKKQSQQRLIYRPSTTFLQKSPLPVLDDISADNILPICRSGYFSQFALIRLYLPGVIKFVRSN